MKADLYPLAVRNNNYFVSTSVYPISPLVYILSFTEPFDLDVLNALLGNNNEDVLNPGIKKERFLKILIKSVISPCKEE